MEREACPIRRLAERKSLHPRLQRAGARSKDELEFSKFFSEKNTKSFPLCRVG